MQAWRFWDILKSKTSFCVTGAGHLTPFHPCGRRGTFCALLKRWQVWVKIGCGFGGHFAGHFYSSIFVARANVLEKSKMCSRNLLFTLGLDLAKRVPLESLYRDLFKRSCQETSYRELVQRSCEETSHRDLVQRSCQEVSYGDLAKRAYR